MERGAERVHDLGRLLINAGDFGIGCAVEVALMPRPVLSPWRKGITFSHHSRSLAPTRSDKAFSSMSLPTSNTTHHPASTDSLTVKLASPSPVMPFKDASTHQSASVKSTLYLLTHTNAHSSSARLTLAFIAFVAIQPVYPTYVIMREKGLRSEVKQ